jgi:hypothetical protein
MRRGLYRLMIRLHPSTFREQFGEEMLCIFDESAPSEEPRLLSDCLVSLPRQWLLRSGAWKLAAGLAISSLILVGWAQMLTRGVSWSLRRGLEMQAILDPPKRTSVLNRNEFSRETAEATAILARIRRAQETRKHDHPSSGRPSGPAHRQANPIKES